MSNVKTILNNATVMIVSKDVESRSSIRGSQPETSLAVERASLVITEDGRILKNRFGMTTNVLTSARYVVTELERSL